MGKVEVKLNTAGVRELLKSAEVADVCRTYAEQVCGRAGDGYVVEQRNYPERTGDAVKAETSAAYRDNQTNNTLIRAITG